MSAQPDLKERLKKGVSVTKAAIAAGNACELASCLQHFRTLGASVETIAEAIKDCPVDLLFKAGFDLRIILATGMATTLKALMQKRRDTDVATD